jgi:PIN like domain
MAALCAPESIQIEHHNARFAPTTPDVDWINKLASEGGWGVITQDRLIKNPPERQALKSTGLLVFILAKQWSHAAHWDKSAALVRWMPVLIGVAKGVSSGAYMVPYNLSGKGKTDPVTL